jgi:hypothetical protein
MITNLRTSLFAIGSYVLLTTAASFTLAQDGPVVVVIRVDTHGRSAEYLKSLKPLLERGRQLNQKQKRESRKRCRPEKTPVQY